MSNLKPANVLLELRNKEITQLDRELRLLEGATDVTEEGDEDENDDFEPQHDLETNTLTNKEMEQINSFIVEMVAQEGLDPTRPLNDTQFEEIFKKTCIKLEESENVIEKKEKNLKSLYSFERF